MGKSFYLSSVSHNALERGLSSVFDSGASAEHTIYHQAAANTNSPPFNLAARGSVDTNITFAPHAAL